VAEDAGRWPARDAGAKDVNATYVSRNRQQLTLLAPEIYGVLVKF
jgi:hypothetical protein